MRVYEGGLMKWCPRCGCCYTNPSLVFLHSSNPNMIDELSGWCKECWYEYKREHKNPLRVCVICGRLKEHYAKGMCKSCYNKNNRNNQDLQICSGCGELKILQAKGMCRSCYCRKYEQPLSECVECGKLKQIQASGKCSSCYQKSHKYPLKECVKCREIREIRANGMCTNCYQKEYNQTERGKEISSRTKSRRRGLGFELLFDSIFNNIETDSHHISDGFVIPIPRDIHRKYNGGSNKEKHRKLLKPIIEEMYEFSYTIIESGEILGNEMVE